MGRNRNWVENCNWSLVWYHQRNETEKWWTARCGGKLKGEDRTTRADCKDGPFLGISPQNGEKCISLLLHYRPILGNSILCPKIKTNSSKQENFISLFSILSTKHPLRVKENTHPFTPPPHLSHHIFSLYPFHLSIPLKPLKYSMSWSHRLFPYPIWALYCKAMFGKLVDKLVDDS